ncbi:MAG: hypothetical protein C4532_19065 [Candidatus Abyssobacteria bacterium SURF_17]|jgi:hypothetical protein|uniref:Uncharacterized protein n=1 Tax=Candidatus Abyssobacteria bacterium SURF_17 TaxID=2093361 RepID=A0A419ENX1_9BACT|nr:MAG: hypothetical protein C4532_19065 [Candidatus Abyssubacteria bacterium SURF_17]
MARDFKILPGGLQSAQQVHEAVSPEVKLRHFRNVSGSMLQSALDTWGDIWNEFQGTITHGFLVTPESEHGFTPECGWPEFLEKMWLMKHYLDCTKRYCDSAH